MAYQATITNIKTGETIPAERSATEEFPAWALEQLGAEAEGEVQHYMDNCSRYDYYDDDDGLWLGPDINGVGIQALCDECGELVTVHFPNTNSTPWLCEDHRKP